jgi:cytochrome c-type biogenesis protein CcmH
MNRGTAWAVAAFTACLLLAGAAAGTTAPGQAASFPEGWTGYAPLAVAPQANLPDLEDEVMCPICGTLLGLSRAPAAERQRVFIRRLIREGKDDQEIKDALVAEYGPQVLALPDDERVNFWVYVVPLAGLILAAAGVLWAGLRWRRQRGGPENAASPQAGPSGAEADRLERELDAYDR